MGLARATAPATVTQLEEEWGDWLVGCRRSEAAVAHFIEAGSTVKALEAAMWVPAAAAWLPGLTGLGAERAGKGGQGGGCMLLSRGARRGLLLVLAGHP